MRLFTAFAAVILYFPGDFRGTCESVGDAADAGAARRGFARRGSAELESRVEEASSRFPRWGPYSEVAPLARNADEPPSRYGRPLASTYGDRQSSAERANAHLSVR